MWTPIEVNAAGGAGRLADRRGGGLFRGVSRQSVHVWRRRFEKEGTPDLADRSRRPRTSRTPSEVETRICRVRREHPWGRRTHPDEAVQQGSVAYSLRATTLAGFALPCSRRFTATTANQATAPLPTSRRPFTGRLRG
ncbi:helix-turn-helix domain-containing protein [Actinoalloteichus fjordicus]|uniref:helix-turn-helix domain-containing protein n=1 Tax=Actinoalloteichus fjordicus TaxID=1612552 RepID=UPI0018DBB7B3